MNWALIGLIAGMLAGLAWMYRANLGFTKTGCVGCGSGGGAAAVASGTTAAFQPPGVDGGVILHGAPEQSQNIAPLPFEPVSISDKDDKYETN